MKEAQGETQATITSKRIELLEALTEHQEIGGRDSAADSLLEVIEHFPKGVSNAFMQAVFPDMVLSKKAALVKSGKIEQLGKKGDIKLKPIAKKQAPRKEEQEEQSCRPAII